MRANRIVSIAPSVTCDYSTLKVRKRSIVKFESVCVLSQPGEANVILHVCFLAQRKEDRNFFHHRHKTLL